MGIALPFVAAAGSAGGSAGAASPLASMAKTDGIQGGMQLGFGIAKQLISAGINNMFAKKQMKLQDKYNRALMDKQNLMQRQLLMDEMPMKMQSYRNAGLSTAALAGQFGGNVSQPMASAGLVAGSSDANFPLDMSAGIGAYKAPSEVITNKSAAEKNFADASLTKYNKYLAETFGPGSAQTMIDSMSIDMVYKVAQTHNAYVDAASTSAMTDAKINEINKMLDINLRTANAQMKYYAAAAYEAVQNGKLSAANARYRIKELDKLDKEIEDFNHKWNVNDAQADQLRALASTYAYEVDNLRRQGKIMEAEAKRLEYENECQQVLGPKFRAGMEVANFYMDQFGKASNIVKPWASYTTTTSGPRGTYTSTTSYGW